MDPRGPLMIEHRLIEKMIEVISREVDQFSRGKQPEPVFIDTMVDFIRTYADRTHHGKEEEIMFKTLAEKKMKPEDKKVMQELIKEHELGRAMVRAIVESYKKFTEAKKQEDFVLLIKNMKFLTQFYPIHIEKEDKVFFPACLQYLTKEDQQQMLAQFNDFDRQMIHEKYEAVVQGLE
jgi:hemerythrin-like domain-containing protein